MLEQWDRFVTANEAPLLQLQGPVVILKMTNL